MSTIINATTTNGVVIQPDNSGSLVLQTNSGTTALTIDTSQNVGIGTSSPFSAAGWKALSIDGTSQSLLDLRISGTSIGYLYAQGTAVNLVNNTATGATVFQTNSAERMRIDSTGNVSITQAAGKYTVDTSGGATSIANGGTVDFPSASGMLVANNQSGTGAVTIYLCGGGNTSAVSNVGTQVGTFAYNVGINGYRWTNNVGSTATFGFFFVRTRTAA